MNVHEFQAKSLFAQFGVPVPKGKEVKTPLQAEKWAKELNSPVFVVKAQIHAGGRGKAGGVKITKSQADVPGLAKELIGKTLITHQTGPKGRKVRRLLIEEDPRSDAARSRVGGRAADEAEREGQVPHGTLRR